MDAPTAPARRPLGLTLLGIVYIVLGAHALLFGAWLATLTPDTAPSVGLAGFLERDPGFTRWYGLALVAIAAPFEANGLGLLKGARWSRWATLAMVPLHIVGPPFLLGGVLWAALANAYLFGSDRAQRFLQEARPHIPETT
ncbi:MAG TPA: hypothetical protein VGR28_07285 [Candidatus Thermoplasmatota archaeon]|nr:hypothetical protein [Candidatus Thermoplasmatota archaeon]